MLSFRHRRPSRRKRGHPPGTLVYTGDQPPGPVRIHRYEYDNEHFEVRLLDAAEAIDAYPEVGAVSWLDVDGVHDVALLRRIGAAFEIHDLTLEDIVHPNQRPKMEEYAHYIFIVLQMMHYDHETADLEAEQVSLVFGENFVLSFQETKEGDAFEPVRTWLREHRGRVRRLGADYLVYCLVDVVVDHYMDILEDLGEHIQSLEDLIAMDPHPELMQRVNTLRRRVMVLRRSIWPLRDVILALERSDVSFIASETDRYFRDVYDHVVRTAEIIESARELLSALSDLHVSALSFRMNEIMKMLAIIATFFLPLSFIAGLYGMNFNPDASPLNMPELDWYLGYPFALTLMAAVATTMYVYFRRRKWL